jgi:hypothetical protein
MRFNTKFACIGVVCLVLALSCLLVTVEAAPTLHLSFYKDNGYGLGNDMQGKWTINTSVSQNVSYVEFYLDDNLQQNDTVTPFSWSFDTANFAEAVHTIKAVAYDPSGESATATVERNFVRFPVTFVVGIIVFAVIVIVVSLVFSLYWVRRKEKKKEN